MKFPDLFLRPEIIITFLWGWEWSGGQVRHRSPRNSGCFYFLLNRINHYSYADSVDPAQMLQFAASDSGSILFAFIIFSSPEQSSGRAAAVPLVSVSAAAAAKC